ncbi:MAG TPA: HEAT repeat domain-containing protein [Armatimonadetes bacterium]|nr:HEAT repeat domain-containing protein [Armatimonadota bacterium]
MRRRRKRRRSFRPRPTRARPKEPVPVCLPSLLKELGDSRSEVRRRAAEKLGEIGHSEAVEPLNRALHDSEAEVRLWAAWALGKIGSPQAVLPLVDLLGREPDETVRRWVAWALGEIGEERAAEALSRALRDEAAGVRFYAGEALARLGRTDLLIRALQTGPKPVQQAAAEALRALDDPAAQSALRAYETAQ